MSEYHLGQLIVEFDWDSFWFWMVLDAVGWLSVWLLYITGRAFLRYRRELRAWREQSGNAETDL